MNNFDLHGRVAIVTGGTTGIGLGAARAMTRAGASVVLAARDAQKGEAAVNSLRKSGAFVTFLPVDVKDFEQCRRLVEQTLEGLGRVDILVNNAGTSVRSAPQDLAIEDWQRVLDTNLSGVLYCSQAVFEPMVHQGGGKIINIGSMMSLFSTWYSAAYSASKGGVVQLTKSLALAWASHNIQVNALLPGWIETAMTSAAREMVPDLYERVVTRTPAGRWGTPDDLEGALVFLASGASDFVTGSTLAIDGGYSAQG
jgi:2-dehydro-3-deoxy-D-gluconate 5-dehydrogenase